MFKKFARTKVTDLTVGRSLAYNFAVPIVQIAGYAVALGGASLAWGRLNPKPNPEPEITETPED